jgi:hypothetical protein
MKRVDVHRAWAPEGDPWSRWVKPVLFASLEDAYSLRDEVEPRSVPPPPPWLERDVVEPLAADDEREPAEHPYRRTLARDLAIVVDLPGALGVHVGVALAGHGFRPVPLYNALPSKVALVDVEPIMRALVDGAPEVARVVAGSPPAFLLDANRLGAGKTAHEGTFDNRSRSWSTDFPSADALHRAGIRRALWIADTRARDLVGTLLDWQARGIRLWEKRPREDAVAAPFVLRRAIWPFRVFAELLDELLLPGPEGAYGKMIERTSGGGG